MLCLRTRRLISAFIDQELDPATASRLSAHLSWCRWCRREAQRVDRGAHLAREARQAAIPPSGSAKLATLLAQLTKPPQAPEASSYFFSLVFVTAFPIAAVATLVYLQDNTSWFFRKPTPHYALDFGIQSQD